MTADEYIASRVGPAFGHRRQPRVRFVRGTRPGYWHRECLHRTRRAAFRCARQRRDETALAFRVAYPKKRAWVVLAPRERPVT